MGEIMRIDDKETHPEGHLFYNLPMEACIVICRTNKLPKRRGKVLFINAKNDVTRKNSQSYLEDSHIARIADAYDLFSSNDVFCAVVVTDTIA